MNDDDDDVLCIVGKKRGRTCKSSHRQRQPNVEAPISRTIVLPRQTSTCSREKSTGDADNKMRPVAHLSCIDFVGIFRRSRVAASITEVNR